MEGQGGKRFLTVLALLATALQATGCGVPGSTGPSVPSFSYRRTSPSVRSASRSRTAVWSIHVLPASDRVTGLAVGSDGRVAMGIEERGHILGRLGLWYRGKLTLYTPPYPAPTRMGFRGTIGPLTWGPRSVWFGANSGVGRFHRNSQRFSAGYINVAEGLAPMALAVRQGTLFFLSPVGGATGSSGMPDALGVRTPAGAVQGTPVGEVATASPASASCLTLDGNGRPWVVGNAGQGPSATVDLAMGSGWQRHRLTLAVRPAATGPRQSGIGVVMGGKHLWLLTSDPSRTPSPLGLQAVNPATGKGGELRVLGLPAGYAQAAATRSLPVQNSVSVDGFTSVGPDLYLLLSQTGSAPVLVQVWRHPWRERFYPLPPPWQGGGFLAVGRDGAVFVAAGNRLARLAS